MSSSPGRKRLVPRSLYWKRQLEKAGLYSAAVLCGGIGLLSLLVLLACLCFGISAFHSQWGQPPDEDDVSVTAILIAAAFFGAIGAGALAGILLLIRAALRIEPVAPITRYNTGLLPAEETLVRSADCPDSVASAELLRATGARQAMSAEQLLRPGEAHRATIVTNASISQASKEGVLKNSTN